MYFVIIDLEWNNSYNKQMNNFFNEIIEIGAVMVDENMEVTDTFSTLIRSKLVKKLTGRVKNLTHITNEDMYGGVSFEKAVSDFSKWIGEKDCVFMSWGNSDIRVLTDNIGYFCDVDFIPFIRKYADAQKFCQTRMKVDASQQIGLSAAAGLLGIDVSEYATHRALDDSLLTFRCFKKVYDADEFRKYIIECDRNFYRRLVFKSKNITDINDERIDRSKMVCMCPSCHIYMKRKSEWRLVNNAFRANFYCKKCRSKAIFTIRFKQCFDHIDIKTRVLMAKKDEEGKTVTGENADA